MMNRIEIMSEVVILDEVKEFLEKQPHWSEAGINLELKKPNKKYRLGTDPTVLIAIVGAAGVGLAALIQGLLQFAEKKSSGEITLHIRVGDTERVLTLPSNTPFDKIEKFWEMTEESQRKEFEKSEIAKIDIP